MSDRLERHAALMGLTTAELTERIATWPADAWDADAAMQWREVGRREWEHPAPPAPNGSARPSTDYFREVRTQATWPDDGSLYAGWVYEDRVIWQGPSAGYRTHVVIHHSQYPAPGVVQPDGRTYPEVPDAN